MNTQSPRGDHDSPLVTILVVDTDPSQVRTLALPLRERGYRVLYATSFPEAQRMWDAEQPQALIADVRLEAYNGLHLLIHARAIRPEVTAIITSPVPDRLLADETRRLGGTFLVKPVKTDDVVAAIEHRAPVVAPTPRVSLAALVYREFHDADGAPSITRKPTPPPERDLPANSARRDSTRARAGRGRR